MQDCIISAANFSTPQIGKLLKLPHNMKCAILDLQKLEMEIQNHGEKVVTHYLSSKEKEHLGQLTSGKRKREWLGGRLAAKHVCTELLTGYALDWNNLEVVSDEYGRPYVAVDKKRDLLPDISISHSGDLAAAMAVSKGLCGIDIQKVTDKVAKVRERFCTEDEEQILHSFFSATHGGHLTLLTKLWAAKEALRKVTNTRSLPGFLELELSHIHASASPEDSPLWIFVFSWKHGDMGGNPVCENYSVIVGLFTDYALALTTRNDSVS